MKPATPPAIARLMEEARNGANAPSSYDRGHNRHNRSGADPQDPPARATPAACAAVGPAGGAAGEAIARDRHSSPPCQQLASEQQPAQSLDKSACGSKERER